MVRIALKPVLGQGKRPRFLDVVYYLASYWKDVHLFLWLGGWLNRIFGIPS